MNIALDLANRLEGILRRYLQCGYNDFGVKANGNLDTGTWKEPIYFALGHRYANAKDDPKKRDGIKSFLGNTLVGENIVEIIDDYEYEGFESKEKAIEAVKKIIEEIEILLK